MSTTTYFIALVCGGLLISALCGVLLPEERTGGLAAAICVGTIITIMAGVAITEILGLPHEVGLAAIAVGPLFVASGRAHSSGGGNSGWGGGWGDGDSGGGGGCGGGGD